MDKRLEEDSLNSRIAVTIYKLINRANDWMLLMVGSMLLAFGFAFHYSSIQLDEASGVFQVPSSERVVQSVPTVDSAHFFDDRVNTVQNHISLKLHEMLTHTSTSFSHLDKTLSTYSQASFPDDILANLRNLKVIDHLLSAEGVSSIEFNLRTIPLVVNAYTPEEISYTSIPLDELNSTIIERWTVEVVGTLILKHSVSRVKSRQPLRFYIDVIDTKGFGKRQDLKMTLMTKWEMIK